ncbi:cytochrome P450, partial [Streptomyces afghaniensis]|uniref:cytochrome P450 n=1 Tax=Streptomyces afghaniensis TaxID=66865 RepID=UPI000FE25B2A
MHRPFVPHQGVKPATERSRDVPHPQAPGAPPLLGHGLQLARSPLPFISSLREHGPVVRIRIGPTPAYVVTDPALTRKVLVTDAAHYAKGG